MTDASPPNGKPSPPTETPATPGSHPTTQPDRAGALCAALGIQRAVVGAPMAKIAGGRLAAAVTAGGGLGFVGAGYGQPEWLGKEIAAAGGARVGIGLITWNIGPDAVAIALSHDPAAIWLSFDDPRPLVGPIHDAGVPLVCQVATLAEAEQAVEAGAAVIVAQGRESGGHGRSEPTVAGLIPEVVAAVDPIPVLAAGGIVDTDGYDRARALGAAGVALGTRLYATEEANDVDEAKQRLVAAGPDDTIRGLVYDIARGPEWPGGYSGRSLRSSFTDTWVGREDEMRADIDEVRRVHDAAAAAGDFDIRVVWAGEGVGGIAAVEPAADVVARFPLAETTDHQ